MVIFFLALLERSKMEISLSCSAFSWRHCSSPRNSIFLPYTGIQRDLILCGRKSAVPICSSALSRRAFSALTCLFISSLPSSSSPSLAASSNFVELPGSSGVRALDLHQGEGQVPVNGDQVAIHYYGRLAAKQGWRFDSTYDHKDETGEPVPFVFVLGSGNVISGIESAVKSMKVGGVRRVIIPPSQGYQNTSQEPLPPNFFDRQRLFTTIFNPTRLANGEGSTLGTLIFDVELVGVRHP